MIIQRPSILIYANNPQRSILKEICAGIEEEGVFYEVKDMDSASLNELVWNAANDSMLGSGIGVLGSSIAFQLRGIPKDHSVESYANPEVCQCRKLGANSARAIKKLNFK